MWNMKDVPIDHVRKGDRNTGSEEVGTSLKCLFPLSSEPQHLPWLDPCQQGRPSVLSWQSRSVGAGQPSGWAPGSWEGPGTRAAAGGMATRVPHPMGSREDVREAEDHRGDISPHCDFLEDRICVFLCNINAITDNDYGQHWGILSCQVLWLAHFIEVSQQPNGLSIIMLPIVQLRKSG